MKKAARNKKSFFEKPAVEPTKPVLEEKKMSNPIKNAFSKRSFQIGTFILCALILVGVLVAYNWLQNGKNVVGSDGKLSNTQVQDLINEVGDKMVLPKDETPTIATVTDVAK